MSDDLVITAHQPNFLPGASVMDKIAASHGVIWLDEVQYTKGGYTNRNRGRDGGWITVPVERNTDGAPINRVRVSEHGDWRRKVTLTLYQQYGAGPAVNMAVRQITRPYRTLVGLNVGLLDALWRFRFGEIGPSWHFQSHLDSGHAVRAVSDDAEELLPISERLAMMVEELGGTVYLSGPSGKRYLDESPFREREIEVRYFPWQGGDNANLLEAVVDRYHALETV